jgi:hypothetical protein
MFAGGLLAQQNGANMVFQKSSHNFGNIQESAGKVNANIMFTNTGSLPLVISNIESSCGCTYPTWTKEPVLPGMKGYVNIIFDPADRPGKFEKTVTVFSNSVNNPVVIKISGNVVAREKTLEELYPTKLGDLRLKSSILSFNNIPFGQEKTKSVEVANITAKNLVITFGNVPKHLTVTAKPQTLSPGEKGEIEVTYNTQIRNDWDMLTDYIPVTVNGESSNYRITVNANVLEDFSKLNETDKQNAAHIKFAQSQYDFGTIASGKKVSFKFTFTNVGKSNLLIRKITATCGCTVVKPDKSEINPGESATLSVTFDSAGKSGRQIKSINVVTNDPDNPRVTLLLRGVVK